MIFIWRRWGWSTLLFLMLVVWLALNPIPAIYANLAGFDDGGLYNSELSIGWAIAWFVGALVMFGFNLLVLRHESDPLTEEQWAVLQKKMIRDHSLIHPKDETPEQHAEFVAGVRALPIPPPRKRSTVFFIPMWIVPFIFVAIGMVMLIVNIPLAMEDLVRRAEFE